MVLTPDMTVKAVVLILLIIMLYPFIKAVYTSTYVTTTTTIPIPLCDWACNYYPVGDTGHNYYLDSICSLTKPYDWYYNASRNLNSSYACSGGFCWCYFKCSPYLKGGTDQYQCPLINPFCAFNYSHISGNIGFFLPFRSMDSVEDFKIPACGSNRYNFNLTINGTGYIAYIKTTDVCPTDSVYDYACPPNCTFDIANSIAGRVRVYKGSASYYNITLQAPDCI